MEERRESQLGRGEEKGAGAGRWDAFFRGARKRELGKGNLAPGSFSGDVMVPKQVWWKLRASLLAAGVDVVVTLHIFCIFPFFCFLSSGAPLLVAAYYLPVSCSCRSP